jgi:hypothetical protein
MLYRIIIIYKRLVCNPPKRHRIILQALLVFEKTRMSCGHLQEVIASTTSSSRNSALIFGNSAEDAKFGVEIFTDVHDGCNITAAVAVVGGGPDGDNRLLGEMILKNVSTCT